MKIMWIQGTHGHIKEQVQAGTGQQGQLPVIPFPFHIGTGVITIYYYNVAWNAFILIQVWLNQHFYFLMTI